MTIREEWLAQGLSTEPADRDAAEHHLTAIYADVGCPPPRFAWVDSPAKAMPLVSGRPTLDDLYRWIRDPRPRGKLPLASEIATSASVLKARLSEGVAFPDPELSPPYRDTRKKTRWPDIPAQALAEAGAPLGVVLHRGIRGNLYRALADRLRKPLRVRLPQPVPVCWYGQHDASWVAWYDALPRLGLAAYSPRAAAGLRHWAGLARSCGWWWPGEDVCVVADRPALVRTVPSLSVIYRDGWGT